MGEWHCLACNKARVLTIDPIQESIKGGIFGKFWSDVKITPFCWPWLRKTTNLRGPRFRIMGRDVKVARVAFFLAYGVWPKGIAFRSCHNDFCVRPDHIIDIKQSDVSPILSRTGRFKNRIGIKRRVCKRGHRLAGDNVGISGKNRFCRICHNARRRARHARLRSEGRTGKI